MAKPIGVDFGATGIKVAMTDKTDRKGITKVTRIGRRPLEDGDVIAGRIQAKKKVATALSAALDDIKAPRGAPLAIAVGGEDVAVTLRMIPGAFKPGEWVEHLRNSKTMAELSPTLRTVDANISVVPLERTPSGHVVAVAGISRKLLADLEAVAAVTGRRIGIIEPSAASLVRSLARPRVHDVAVIVDIGHSQTIIACRKGPDLLWVECIPTGGKTITEVLAQQFKLSQEDAAQLKATLHAEDVDDDAFGKHDAREQAIGFMEDDDDEDVWGKANIRDIDPEDAAAQAERDQTKALTARVDELIDDIASVIESRMRDDGAPAPDGVLITGRGGLVPGTVERMQERLRVPVHGGLPMADIAVNKFSRPYVQRDPSGGSKSYRVPSSTQRDFAVAIGAAQHPQVR